MEPERNESKTRMLKAHLMREMLEQQIPVGGRLPSENQLIERFSVSRTTVRQVLTELSSEGLVQRQQGRGTFRTARNIQQGGSQSIPSMLVGVWFNWASGPLFGPVSEGIRDELCEWGYHAVFESGGFQPGDEQRGIRSLIEKGLDGFIVSPSINREDRHEPLFELFRRRIPVVLVDHAPGGIECDVVSVHSERAAEEIVEHLIQLGHRRIGFVGLSGVPTVEERLCAYRSVMRRHGCPIDPDWIQVNDHVAVDSGRLAARTLLELPADRRPTAVFAINDWIAVIVATVARELGMRIPEDVSVAGFDDDHVQLQPGESEWLTTYAQPGYYIGREAAELLMKRIRDPQRQNTRVLLQGKLIPRISTSPVGSGPVAAKPAAPGQETFSDWMTRERRSTLV